jgi:hypothetical protein
LSSYNENIAIVLLEDHVPIENELSFKYEYPPMVLAADVLAFFDNCSLSCKIVTGSHMCDMDLVLGQNRIPIEKRDEYLNIYLYIKPNETLEDTIISHLSITFLDMNPLPINPADIVFRNKPAHLYAMGIDFTDAIESARGFEDCLDKEAQIMSPQGDVITVRTSTGNFAWREYMLLCRMPIAIEYRVRLRYNTSKGWSDWSEWQKFVCRRKMSL